LKSLFVEYRFLIDSGNTRTDSVDRVFISSLQILLSATYE